MLALPSPPPSATELAGRGLVEEFEVGSASSPPVPSSLRDPAGAPPSLDEHAETPATSAHQAQRDGLARPRHEPARPLRVGGSAHRPRRGDGWAEDASS
jgi:hypothetical protein